MSPLTRVKVERKTANGKPTERVLEIRGVIEDSIKDRKLHYFAASPADLRCSDTGYGLPYASFEQAFHATPNVGTVPVKSDEDSGKNEFVVTIPEALEPNAYYVGLGTQYVPPTVHVWYVTSSNRRRNVAIKLNDGKPFRTLTHPTLPTRPRSSALFYTPAPTFARSQEQIIRESKYPSPEVRGMPANFWGLKPPV